MNETKRTILKSACALFEKKGFHATSINEIVAESQAPKGSLYYYFPGGKDQIAVEAIGASGKQTAARIRENLSRSAASPLADFITQIGRQMSASGFSAGSPLSIVAAETSSMDGPVNAACREAYTALISAMADALRENGRKEEEARDLALFTIAVIEGGILLGRTFHSVEPLNTSKKFLSNMIQEKKEVNG